MSLLAFIFAAGDDILKIVATLIFFALAIVGQIFSAKQEAQKNKPPVKQQPDPFDLDDELVLVDDEIVVVVKQPKEKLRRKAERDTYRPTLSVQPSPQEERLAKVLQPQGEGARFEARPGTLDESQIVSPSVAPTINPNLDSITGAFDESSQPFRVAARDGLNLRQLLTTPQGIRQAVVLSEIMKRPEF